MNEIEPSKLFGNDYWKKRTKHGRDKLFSSPEILREACEEYFNSVTENPINEAKLVSFEGISKLEIVPRMRAMTIMGLCAFLQINRDTWYEWRKNEDKDYSDIISWVDDVIRDQKFTGAAAGLLNSNIIARDLGLTDKTEQKYTVSPTILDDVPNESES